MYGGKISTNSLKVGLLSITFSGESSSISPVQQFKFLRRKRTFYYTVRLLVWTKFLVINVLQCEVMHSQAFIFGMFLQGAKLFALKRKISSAEIDLKSLMQHVAIAKRMSAVVGQRD